MSVLSGPGRVRRTGRAIARIRTALCVAAVDAATVGCWFALVVVESRTLFTALAGLTVLWFGALLRTGFVMTVGRRERLSRPRWVCVSGFYAAIWIGWLLLAEATGGRRGIVLAGGVLAAALAVHFSITGSLARTGTRLRSRLHPGHWSVVVVPAVALAVGASTLLGIVWLADAVTYTTTVAVGTRSIVLQIHALLHGGATLACCSFVGTHRLLSRATAR